MPRRKLQRFKENQIFPNLYQPDYEELKTGFFLKGKWRELYFKNNHPIILELGCGKGEYTIALAERFPEKNFIGIDLKGARIWVGCRAAIDKGLGNVSFIRRHISGIEHLFDPAEVDEIWITFPDPHLREREARKRLTSPEYIARFAKVIKPGGIIHLKTDNQLLYDYTLDVAREHHFEIVSHSDDIYGEQKKGPVTEVQTYYEKIWLEEGLKIKYIRLIPIPENPGDNAQLSFFEKVWKVTRQIPPGKVTTYGAIATYLGSTGSARMVGWALNSSQNAKPPVPAHRVVNRNGMLTGKLHFVGVEAMQKLLESEGIAVQDNKIENFDQVFWNPDGHLPRL